MRAVLHKIAVEWVNVTRPRLSGLRKGEIEILEELLQDIDREAREECARLCENMIVLNPVSDRVDIHNAVCYENARRIRAQIQQPEAPAEGSGT